MRFCSVILTFCSNVSIFVAHSVIEWYLQLARITLIGNTYLARNTNEVKKKYRNVKDGYDRLHRLATNKVNNKRKLSSLKVDSLKLTG